MAGAGVVLTDGVAGSGWFWRNGTMLGWSWRTPVTVTIELAASAPVDNVRVEAGAKRGGEAYYPSQLLVYGAAETGGFEYLGASSVQRDADSPNAGTIRPFDINFPARKLRRIKVVAFSRGAFIWLSEIEVRQAEPSSIASTLGGSLSAAEVVTDAARRRRDAIGALPGPTPSGPDAARRWTIPLRSGAEIAPQGCSIERIEPWSDAPRKESVIDAAAPLITAPGGLDYAAFRISNRGDAPRAVSVTAGAATGATITWQALAHVRDPDYAWVADVVTPFDRTALPPRSEMLVLAEVSGRRSQTVQLDVACGDATASLRIPLRVIEQAGTQSPLHGALWVYTHQKEQAQIASALVCDPDALARFGMDTQVVHPDALLDNGKARPDALFARYLRDFRTARRLLLGMDVKTRSWAFKSMSDDDAVRSLGAWWAWVKQAAETAGFKGEIILYPVDEPQPDDVPLVLRTRDLLRRAGVTAPMYATVEHKTALALKSLDILQLHNPTEGIRRSLRPAEVQSYFTKQDGRLLSPNDYYRVQGWQAYELGLTGVGFWALWDSTGAADPASGWDMFTGTRERDFGAMYQGTNGCGWPSRRLIAWRRGIEENRLLRACAGEGTGEARPAAVRNAQQRRDSATLRAALEAATRDCQ
jgi:hypothetical protein